jgi:hypothetical protein
VADFVKYLHPLGTKTANVEHFQLGVFLAAFLVVINFL